MNTLSRLTTLAVIIFGYGVTTAQTVTSYAGKENSIDPWSNFNNSSANKADAYFYEPEGITWDINGLMYITERNKIRIIKDGKVYNRSGNLGDGNSSHGYSDGTGIVGGMYHPRSIVDKGNGEMFIVDSENHAIRKLSAFKNTGNGQILSTVAGAKASRGQGTAGHKDGSGTSSRFDTPKGMVADGKGNFYICDDLNFVIRKMTSGGSVSTIAGKAGTEGNNDASNGSSSTFGGPHGIAMYDANHVIITDNWNSSIRKVNLNTGATTTICGVFGQNWHKDGSLKDARFNNPKGIVVVDGLIYVADNSAIRVIDEKNGTVSTFAGSGSAQANKDGVGSEARFGRLAGLAFDGNNTLYVTDVYFNVIKKITIDNLAPVANFSATKTNLQVNEETTISDNSGGKEATQRTWTVEDISGSSSNVTLVSGQYSNTGSEDITVKFGATGFYSVKLEVTNEYGSDAEEKKSFMNVSTTGSVENINELSGVQLFPNPNNGNELHIRLVDGVLKNATVQVFDIIGTQVASFEDLNGLSNIMKLPSLESGAYIVVISQEGLKGAKRLIVE